MRAQRLLEKPISYKERFCKKVVKELEIKTDVKSLLQFDNTSKKTFQCIFISLHCE